ncbi:3-ketoacyl-ACP reductase [Aureimonas sp. Leaf454]|uniref:SDR family oxidoreductase n=1 Tax=Aureimonas sp. Leaf454 TaxID=1736381 RepID=UPI0006F2EF37|nr:SDR family oxidoreductase [Aureimonas sp. Leaf454]KQT53742.1 3-ketoacyl-ACP reductase [Aureimonas sp. Leaf454]
MPPGLLSGLEGQRVVVTAGAGGIGLATARLLHAQGCRVALCDVSTEALDAVAAELPGVTVASADVSDETEVARFFDIALEALGGLDGLVNNAGIAGPTGGVEEISVADWRRCLDIGLTGQFLCTRLAVPHLKAAGGGAIVNMSSSAGRHGYAYRTPYAAAKFGVIGFTQSLAKELGPSNIRVNAVLPGIVAGPRMEKVIRDRAAQVGVPYEEMETRYLEKVSLRRMVTAEDVAGSIAFLLSAAGRNLSAMSFNVDGNVETL